MLTRREWLSLIGRATGTLAFAPVGKLSLASELVGLTESKEEFKKSRQKELEQLVNSPYANVVYDHDRTLAKQAVSKSPYRVEHEQLIDQALVITASDEKTFGLGVKSTIYAFKEFFEPQEIRTTKGTIILKPTLERKKVQLEAEIGNAEDNYRGFVLENGLPINSSNYGKINRIVRYFVNETRGYLRQIDLSRKLENPSPEDLEKGKFEHLPPGYFSILVGFLQHLQKLKPEIDKGENYNDTEREYIKNQVIQIRKRAPEIFKLVLYK